MVRRRSTKITGDNFTQTLAERLRQKALNPDIGTYSPHEKQEIFHRSTAKRRQFIGGNRSGKTVGGVVEDIFWLTGKHPYRETPEPPIRGRIVTTDFLQGVEKVVRPEVQKWLPLSEIQGGSWESGYDKELRTLWLENGSFVEFMSYDQDLDKFSGTSRHFIHFDEEPPYDIYKECMARLVDTDGDAWFTMTPVEGMTWTYDDIYLKSKINPEYLSVEVDIYDNPHLSDSAIDFFLSDLTDDERDARIHGKYVQRMGLIYKHFNDDLHIIDPLDADELNPEWLYVNAMDHGFTNPTAWLWSVIQPDGKIIIYDEYYQSGDIVRNHAFNVHRKNTDWRIRPYYNVGDPSIRNVDPLTGTSVHLEYIEHGLSIVLGNNDVNAGINRVARYLGSPPFEKNKKPKLFITANCVNLITEMRKYSWGQWAHRKMEQTRNKKEDPQKKDDHACDALRYLISSRPKADDGKPSITEEQYKQQHDEMLSEMVGASKAIPKEGLRAERLTPVHKGEYTETDFTLGGMY